MNRSLMILALTLLAFSLGSTGCNRPTNSTIGLAPELQEVAALAHNRTSDENIIGYIRNSGKTYRVTANDIVILTKNGVSQNVIGALMQQPAPAATPTVETPTPVPTPTPVATAAPAPTPVIVNVNNAPAPAPATPVAAVTPSATAIPAPAPVAPEPAPSPEYFEAQLAPYGQWMYLPEFNTRCWVPAGLPPGWRPYFDNGHWVYTDSGMYWESEHPWGAIPFHYGRWVFRGSWIWVPAYEYAPSWVIWRHGEGHMGWAPVPPGAMFVGGGWDFHGQRVAVDFDFGLSPNLFVFVGGGHFLDHDFHRHELHGDEWHHAFAHSEMNHFVHDEHSHGFRVEGLERNHVEIIIGHRVEPVRHEEVRVHALENLHRNTAHPPAAEAHELPAHSRVEPVGHTPPVHENKADHAGTKPAVETHPQPTPPRAEPVGHTPPVHDDKVDHTGTKPAVETHPQPTPPRTEPVGHTPVHEEKVDHTGTKPVVETHPQPTPARTEPVAHSPAHEEKVDHTGTKPAVETHESPTSSRFEPTRLPDRSSRIGGRPATVENPALSDTPTKTTSTDPKHKRKDSDQPTADQN